MFASVGEQLIYFPNENKQMNAVFAHVDFKLSNLKG